MKKSLCLSACAAVAALLAAGCSHLSLADSGGLNRTLVGYVDFTPPGGSAGSLPDGAEMLVRVVDEHPAPAAASDAGMQPLYRGQSSGTAPAAPAGPQVLGEATLHQIGQAVQQMPGGGSQIPFQIEFQADDDQLRRGLNVEVHISWGGQMHYTNANQYAVSLGDVDPQHPTHVGVRVEQMR